MKRITLCVVFAAVLGLAFAGCGSERSGSGIEVLNVEFFGDGKPQIKLVDPDEGVRTVRVGDKVNGMTVLGADDKGVTFLSASGERVYVGTK